jgi:hypothetical protein
MKKFLDVIAILLLRSPFKERVVRAGNAVRKISQFPGR